MAAPAYRHVLFATDFGPESAAIGARAVELARHYDAKLSLIHVVEYVPFDTADDLLMPAQLDIEESLVKTARVRLRETAEALGVPDAPHWVEVGSTKREILSLAEREHVDLIVLGSHGRSGLARLLGATANAVLHGAPCDVLAVRVGDHDDNVSD
jgi:universal stress protein A